MNCTLEEWSTRYSHIQVSEVKEPVYVDREKYFDKECEECAVLFLYNKKESSKN